MFAFLSKRDFWVYARQNIRCQQIVRLLQLNFLGVLRELFDHELARLLHELVDIVGRETFCGYWRQCLDDDFTQVEYFQLLIKKGSIWTEYDWKNWNLTLYRHMECAFLKLMHHPSVASRTLVQEYKVIGHILIYSWKIVATFGKYPQFCVVLLEFLNCFVHCDLGSICSISVNED